MPEFDFHERDDLGERSWYRATQTLGRATLLRGDDSQPYQLHQIEGYRSEVRANVQRLQHFGFSAMPLPGAKALISWERGYRGYGSIIGVEDGRYRPIGLNPGEFAMYMVDGAASDGTGGTMRPILRGQLGGKGELLGVTINVGDSNTTNVTVTGSGLITLAGNVEITGTLKVDGATTVADITINGTETGGGPT